MENKFNYIVTIADLGEINNLKTTQSECYIKSLRKTSSEVKVICRDYKNSSHKYIQKAIPLGRVIPFLLNGVQKYFYSNFPSRIISQKFFDFSASLKIKDDCNLCVIIPPVYPEVIKSVREGGGISIVHGGVAHNNHVQKMISLESSKKIKKDKKLDESLEEADYILALSEFAKKTYIDAGIDENKIFVTPLGVDPEIFKLAKKRCDIFRIVCVADYGLLKGFQYLLKAWEELNLKNAELIFVGTPDFEMEKINNYYKNRLNNFKTVSHTEPLPYYQQCSILVHPSLTEGCSKVILEAMACGKPIICTEESGSIVEDGEEGFIIKSRDVESIKKRLLYFYKNPKSLKKMGNNSRSKIENHYTWDDYSEKLKVIFKEIIKREKKHARK